MTSKNKNNVSGFTLIELLVVIAIIALLASIVMSSLGAARAKGRDAKRMSDLNQIRTGLFLYYDKFGSWIETGSGCGWNGNGSGWFSYSGSNYPQSISQCLVNSGFIGDNIVDPTGGTTSVPATGFAYMKYTCNSSTTTHLFAKLEGRPQSSTATDGTCCSTCDSSFGMNYYITVK